MTTPTTWKKSSYSGGGDGNNCVEIATAPTHISIRDSKDPTAAPLTLPVEAFTRFVEGLRRPAARDRRLRS